MSSRLGGLGPLSLALIMHAMVVACATQNRRVSVPRYDKSLTPSLASFLAIVRQPCPVQFDRSFASVAQSYSKRDYTSDEFSNALQSLALAATTQDAVMRLTARRESDVSLLGDESGEPLILYVNPTCEECARVVSLVIDAKRRTESRFPPVILRLLPSHEDDSIRAATMLEVIRHRDRGVFTSALLDVMQSVPEGKAPLDTVLAPYWKSAPSPDSVDWKEASRRLDQDAQALAAIEIPPPFGVFHGHRVARYRGAKVPFDTFHDADSLILAISAIETVEKVGNVCSQEEKRNN